MLANIVIIAGLIIGWAFSWGTSVGILLGIVRLLNMAGVAIEFNIYVATVIWLIMICYVAYLLQRMETNHGKHYMIWDILEMIGEVLLWVIGILAALLIIILLGILIYGLLFDPSIVFRNVVVTVH